MIPSCPGPKLLPPMAVTPLHPKVLKMNTRIEQARAAAPEQHDDAEHKGERLDDADDDAVSSSEFKPIEERVAEVDPAKQLTD